MTTPISNTDPVHLLNLSTLSEKYLKGELQSIWDACERDIWTIMAINNYHTFENYVQSYISWRGFIMQELNTMEKYLIQEKDKIPESLFYELHNKIWDLYDDLKHDHEPSNLKDIKDKITDVRNILTIANLTKIP